MAESHIHYEDTQSVGIVHTQYFTFAEQQPFFQLESGKSLGPVTLAYEIYGQYNADKSNVVLILHALSGDAHAAGRQSHEDVKPGWWDAMIGPGKAFDTNKYCVICSNVIGGCKGSTGPGSLNPQTGKRYGMAFPVLTIRDMVRAQKELIDHLGIKKLLAVSGGSMGGMQALEWIVQFPQSVQSAVIIAAASYLSAQAIAFNEVGRNAIFSDRHWNNGEYYESHVPATGLSIARMIGHITYLSNSIMERKFGRQLRDKTQYSYDFTTDFQVESYLHYQGAQFVERFDANSYLYLTKAMDYFDLVKQYGSLEKAFEQCAAKCMVVSFSSDWLYPSYQSKEIVKALMNNNKDVSYCELKTDCGHDAFLLQVENLTAIIKSFLQNV